MKANMHAIICTHPRILYTEQIKSLSPHNPCGVKCEMNNKYARTQAA